jgi:hypothetical protein
MSKRTTNTLPLADNNKKRYPDVRNLSMKDLNTLCTNFAIDTSDSRAGKENLVCQALGVSTIGLDQANPAPIPHHVTRSLTEDQLTEYNSLTPLSVHTMTGWTSATEFIPYITDEDVKLYLVNSSIITEKEKMNTDEDVKLYLVNSCIITEKEKRSYHVTRPYRITHGVPCVAL